MGGQMIVLLLACLTMLASATQPNTESLPATSQALLEAVQNLIREELGKLSSEIQSIKNIATQLTTNVDKLTVEVKAQRLKIEKVANDLKVQGTEMKEWFDVTDDLNTAFRDLRKGIVNQLENQEKIEWSITDGSLAPRNTSWVVDNFKLVMSNMNGKMDELWSRITGALRRVQDCSKATMSGVYTIVKPGLELKAYCQVDKTGKWTVIQRRTDGSVNFTRSWMDYRQGFGDVAGEHWLGNDDIHALTAGGLTRLRIDLLDWENNKKTVYYNVFRVAGAVDKYKLTVFNFVGAKPPGDSLASQNGMKFSTYDQDNDSHKGNCAIMYRGGWWYAGCHASNLNGEFNNTAYAKGIVWYHWKGHHYSLRDTMMISKP